MNLKILGLIILTVIIFGLLVVYDIGRRNKKHTENNQATALNQEAPTYDYTVQLKAETDKNILQHNKAVAKNNTAELIVKSGTNVTLSWQIKSKKEAQKQACFAAGDWTGRKKIADSIEIKDIRQNKLFALECSGEVIDKKYQNPVPVLARSQIKINVE